MSSGLLLIRDNNYISQLIRKVNPAPVYTSFLQGVMEEKGLKREECAKNKGKGKGGTVRDKVSE
jgi:hypothetical protein